MKDTYSVVLHIIVRGRSCSAREVYRTPSWLRAKWVAYRTWCGEYEPGRLVEVEVMQTNEALAWLSEYRSWLGAPGIPLHEPEIGGAA